MSLFSNSNANRRIKRGGPKRSQSLLEVTTRPDKEGQVFTRKRVVLCLKGILTAAVVSVVAIGGRTAVQRLVWENPSYAISDIRFSTDGMLTRAQVLDTLGLWEGRNIFTVDIGKLRTALDALPQVDRAEVRRSLPDRIDIRIVERQPVAWVAASAEAELSPGGNAFLVDSRGTVMRTRKVLPEHLALPLIVGVHMEDVAPGQRLPTPESIAAVELLRLGSDDIRWQPRTVDVSKGYCLLVTDQRKARVTFAFDGIESQLNRLRQLLDTVEPMQRELQTVNLMLERNVPVTFAPLPPPVVPEKAKGKSPQKVSAPTLPVSTAVTAEQISKAQAAAATAATNVSASTGAAPVGGVSGGVVNKGSSSPIIQMMAKRETVPTPPVVSRETAPAKESAANPVVRETARDEPAKEAPTKPKVAKAPEYKPERASDTQSETAPAKPVRKKVETSDDAPPPKAIPVEKPHTPKQTSPPQAPGTLSPNEGLRRLFQPHG